MHVCTHLWTHFQKQARRVANTTNTDDIIMLIIIIIFDTETSRRVDNTTNTNDTNHIIINNINYFSIQKQDAKSLILLILII